MDNPLIGKTVTSAYLAADKLAIKFVLSDGAEMVVQADADCCSKSWIESVDNLEQLLHSPVTAVEDVSLPDKNENFDGGDLRQFYACKIHTTRGYALIDYRNESNGYYGGSLTWPGERHYGGVFDQNVSDYDWKPL